MVGDKYHICFSLDGKTVQHSTVDDWSRAKELRGNIFDQNKKIRAVWIMRSNPSLGLRQDRWGFTLHRTKHDVA